MTNKHIVAKRREKLPFTFSVQSRSSTASDGRRRPSIVRKKFEAVRELGSGGFGRVYEVRRVEGAESGARYACKVFDRSYYREDASESMKQCFVAEMQINRKMRHPNIVEFKYLLRDDRYYYMFMELVSGRSVDKIIDERVLPDRVVRNAFRQMVEAVYYIHRQNVVHLDIKPSNFIAADEDMSHIKLCDFGLAREINGAFEMHDGIAGTPNFTAPEVLFSDGKSSSYTQAADVWALGCCLYSLLFGVSPFESPKNSVKEIYALIKSGNIRIPSSRTIDKDARRIIERCLDSNPRNRPSCAEILLSPYFTAHPSEAGDPSPQVARIHEADSGEPSPKRRRPLE